MKSSNDKLFSFRETSSKPLFTIERGRDPIKACSDEIIRLNKQLSDVLRENEKLKEIEKWARLAIEDYDNASYPPDSLHLTWVDGLEKSLKANKDSSHD